jgi:signal transduction histidine kinase
MASHEFRTPLSTILSSAYLVTKYQTESEQPRREKHIQRIVSSVNMLTDILNDFLSVGRIEEGKIQVRYSEFSLPDIIKALINEMQTILKNGQQIDYLHTGDEKVILDATLIKHIVMNLLSNAIKFSPENSSMVIRSENKDDLVTLAVKDAGLGISREDQQHLFERFFRGENVTNIQGTGLGLHIVGKYAELMNGTVVCHSELNKGTEFIINFVKNQNDN